MIRKPFWFAQAAVLALALSVVTACDDEGTNGDPDAVDPVGTSTVVDATVDQFFENNEALQGLDVLGGAMITALGGASPAVVLWDMIPSDAGPIVSARRIQASVMALAGSEPAKIPSGALETTFVIEDPAEGYIPSSRTGAPANGVRFILYEVDASGNLVVPLVEIGWVDIIDDSNLGAGTVNISLEAVVDGVTLVDITSIGTFTQTDVVLDFDGTLSDGTNSLTFAIDVTASETGAEIGFSMTAGSVSVTEEFQFTETGGASLTATFTDGDNSIVVTMNFDASEQIGSGSGIAFNGQTVAVISGTLENPTITNAEGDPLTDEELAALDELFAAMVDITEFFVGVFEFSFLLLLFAG